MPRCLARSRAVTTVPTAISTSWSISDPAIVVTIFDYAGVKEFIADMFDRPVDVVSRESLKPRVRPKATADAIYAF